MKCHLDEISFRRNGFRLNDMDPRPTSVHKFLLSFISCEFIALMSMLLYGSYLLHIQGFKEKMKPIFKLLLL